VFGLAVWSPQRGPGKDPVQVLGLELVKARQVRVPYRHQAAGSEREGNTRMGKSNRTSQQVAVAESRLGTFPRTRRWYKLVVEGGWAAEVLVPDTLPDSRSRCKMEVG
jgi:hypothetical protein